MYRKLLEDIKEKRFSKLLAGGLTGLVIVVSVGWMASAVRPESRPYLPAEIVEVQRGPLTISVVESGTIRPREQVVLKNRLDDPSTILYIVEEGTVVKKGDLLVELDITRVENELIERRIRVQNDEADYTHARENLSVVTNQAQADIDQAELDYKFAVQDLEKYKNGEYPKLLKEAEAKITLAEEELSQAQEELKWSEILYKEKYLSQSELKQDQLAAQKAELNLELAISDRNLLEEYTYQRQIDQLESDVSQAKMALERSRRLAAANIAQAKAQLAAREAELKEERDRMERQEREIQHAKIYAPINGMVIYASSVRQRWRNNEEPIRTGTMVDERDDIIYLPTASEFDATIKIPEVSLNKIRPGMPVRIHVDALPEAQVTASVKSIAQLPDAESRYLNPNLKLYETVIAIDATDAPLRNGMSCRAEVVVETYDDVLFIPLQALTRFEGGAAVYRIGADGEAKPHPVEIGLDNARFVHIRSGLEEGDRVLMAPPLTDSSRKVDGEESEDIDSEADDGNEPTRVLPPENLPEREET